MEELIEEQLAETQRLIDHALAGVHSVQKVENHAQSVVCGQMITATKKIAKGFKILAGEVYREYLKADQITRCDSTLAVGINNLLIAANFYVEEVKLLKKARKAYWKYLWTTPIPELFSRWLGNDES